MSIVGSLPLDPSLRSDSLRLFPGEMVAWQEIRETTDQLQHAECWCTLDADDVLIPLLLIVIMSFAGFQIGALKPRMEAFCSGEPAGAPARNLFP